MGLLGIKLFVTGSMFGMLTLSLGATDWGLFVTFEPVPSSEVDAFVGRSTQVSLTALEANSKSVSSLVRSLPGRIPSQNITLLLDLALFEPGLRCENSR